MFNSHKILGILLAFSLVSFVFCQEDIPEENLDLDF